MPLKVKKKNKGGWEPGLGGSQPVDQIVMDGPPQDPIAVSREEQERRRREGYRHDLGNVHTASKKKKKGLSCVIL
jgi:hypothetical protein